MLCRIYELRKIQHSFNALFTIDSCLKSIVNIGNPSSPKKKNTNNAGETDKKFVEKSSAILITISIKLRLLVPVTPLPTRVTIACSNDTL